MTVEYAERGVTHSSVQCNWSSSASYSRLFTGYTGLLRSMSDHVDHDNCIDLPILPTYSWIEIIFVIITAILMAHVRFKCLNRLIDTITQHVTGLPRHAAFKIAMYSVKFVETSAFVLLLLYLLLVNVECSAVVNLDMFNNPPEYDAPLEILSLLAMARTLSHLHDVLVSRKYDRRKDDHVLVIHHIVTIMLLVTARHNMLIGMWVLLLHDICDPIIDLCKIAQNSIEYLPPDIDGRERKLSLLSRVQDVSCVLLIAIWILCRLFLFPNRLIHATIVSTSLKCRYAIGFTCSTLFLILMVMHVMWFYLIIKFVLIRLFYGKRKDTTDPEIDDINSVNHSVNNCHHKTQ